MLNKSYAYWKMSYQQTEVNSLASECFEMDFSDSNAIKLNNVMSILNSEGEQLKPYNVTIKNICDNDIKYQVNIETLNNKDKLADKYITAKVNYEDNKVLTSYDTTEGIITDHSAAYKVYEGHLKKDQVMSIDVRMWMGEEVELYETVDGTKKDISSEIMNKEFQSKVTIEAEVDNQTGEYKEEILNGTDPVIKDDLIPVIIGENGKVTRADTSKKWYNYANSEWANAVILAEGKEDPGAGKPIPEDDIESYFVWIPKYSYQLWDLGLYEGLTSIDESKVHTIPIKFGTTDTNDSKTGECTTPMTEDKKQGKSGASDNCQVGEFMTHPAFISFGVNGLWVGKFETGYKDANSAEDAANATNTDNVAIDQIVIKPNVYSWRGINVANAFENSYQYKRYELDSHMMKNTEWGAVAYLSHSKYGKYTVKDGNTEIMLNNSSNYVTGYASKDDITDKYGSYSAFEDVIPNNDSNYSVNYNNPDSVIASTTGNYSGIYDMNGGAQDYVMNLVKDTIEDKLMFSKSGFDSFDYDKKYCDVYNYGTNNNELSRRILGDATGEMGPFVSEYLENENLIVSSWYNDFSTEVYNNSLFYKRGSRYKIGINGGIFSSAIDRGYQGDGMTYRIVLAPQSAS